MSLMGVGIAIALPTYNMFKTKDPMQIIDYNTNILHIVNNYRLYVV